MIEMYAGEALDKQSGESKGDLVVALCCCHYGFARTTFKEVFDSLTERPVVIIDPNVGMGEYMFPPDVRERRPQSQIEASVVSRAEIPAEERTAISAAVRTVSSATADAVASYKLDTTLFSF
jgi:hypothetical protein